MLQTPVTPTHNFAFRARGSSPLAFEMPSSPLAGPSATNRSSQYKSRTSSRRTPTAAGPSTPTHQRRVSAVPLRGAMSMPANPSSMRRLQETPNTALLREQFKARCIERAASARSEAVRRKRYASSEAGSSDVDMNDEESEDEEVFMADEVRGYFGFEAHWLTCLIAVSSYCSIECPEARSQLPALLCSGGWLVRRP
jgi:hypothetical protein